MTLGTGHAVANGVGRSLLLSHCTRMAPLIPHPATIKSFRTGAAFEAWLKAHHARETEIWIKVHKKGSGLASITTAQALDVALCRGWIDGLRKDEPGLEGDRTSVIRRWPPQRRAVAQTLASPGP